MNKHLTRFGLIIGIILIINLLSEDLSLRLDFTEDHQYTLSQATKDILENLEQPVTVKAYFSQDLPPNVASVRRDFKDLLIEYANRSNGMFMYEIINPNENEETEKEVLQDGVQAVLINMREKDQIKQQKAYLGAVVKVGDSKEVIPFMQPGTPLEYALSSAIKKISIQQKPTIGILSGQGEAGLDEMTQARGELEIMYDLNEIQWTDSTKISTEIKTLAILRPTDSISQGQLRVLDTFLDNGGNLLLAFNSIKADLQSRYGSLQKTGLEKWLAKKGINVEDNLVADIRCGAVTVQQQQGNFRYMSQVQFPYLPIISKFSDHSIVKGLEGIILPFVSPISYTGDSSLTFTPLAFSSEKSAKMKAPIFFQIEKRWTDQDFPEKGLVLAAAIEGKISPKSTNKMVVIGNGDFALSGKESRKQVQKDNLSLLVNSIDWLSDDTGLVELRTKGITNRPLDELEDGTRTLLKYLNFLLPIFIVLLIGFIRMQRNKNIRIKRMEESYE
jgi:gliding-associated putative ABC transporter substrate-binding component GldG